MSAAGKPAINPAAPDTVVVLRTVDGKRMCKLFRRSTSGQVYRTDYDKAYLYAVELHRCDGIRGAHKLLVRLEPDPHACIIRGAPDETTPRHRTPRQKAKPGNPNGHFLEVPRQLVQLDIDGIPPPPGMDVLSEPEEAAHAIAEMAAGYAPELDGVTVVVQHASSAGVSDLSDAAVAAGLPNPWAGIAEDRKGISARVWAWLETPRSEPELLRWFDRLRAAGLKVDTALARTVQPHYTAAPPFLDGLSDHLAGRRTFLIEGDRDTAELDIPPPEPPKPRAERRSGDQADTGGDTSDYFDAIHGASSHHHAMVAAAGSFVARNWPEPDLAWLKEELRRRARAAAAGVRSASRIAELTSDEHIDEIIEWVMGAQAAKRAAMPPPPGSPLPPDDADGLDEEPPERPAPTYPDKGVGLGVAEGLLEEAVARFVAAVGDGQPAERLVRVTVGGGKSEKALEGMLGLVRAVRKADGERAPYMLTPRHDLNEELVKRFSKLAPGLRTFVWRGMDAENPADKKAKMCGDPALPKAAGAAGLSMTAACGACPLRKGCAYYNQPKAAKGADVILAAHNLAFEAKPSGLAKCGALVIDEAFHSAALKGVDDLHPIELALSDLEDERTGAVAGDDRNRLLAARRTFLAALEGHGDGALRRAPLEAAGMAAHTAGGWMDLEWAMKPDVDLKAEKGSGLPRETILERLGQAAEAGFRRARPTLARLVRELLRGKDAASPNITVTKKGTALRFRWREDFADWAAEAPKLFLDATSQPEYTRVWAPRLAVTDIEIDAPHQHVRQVPREFGRRFFTENEANIRRLADLATVELAATDGDLLIVAQKAVVGLLDIELAERFGEGKRPERLKATHYGNFTGLNKWQGVARALLVGRPALNRRACEKLAEIVKGSAVEPMAGVEGDKWPLRGTALRMADGTGYPIEQPFHPDPLVEAIRYSITEGAVQQALGRPRGVRRTEERPVHVTILAAMALPVTVNETMAWEDIQPSKLALAAAEAALGGRALPLAPDDLSAARPDLWATPGAAGKAIERCKGLRDALETSFHGKGNTPKTLIGDDGGGIGPKPPMGATAGTRVLEAAGPASQAARYRRAGRPGRAAWALVPVRHGLAALTAALGAPPAMFEAPGQPGATAEEGPTDDGERREAGARAPGS